LVTPLDEWLYALKHAPELEEQPDFLSAREINHFFDLARYSNFTEEERHMYRTAQQVKWDNENALDFAKNKAEKIGREIGREIGHEIGHEIGLEAGRKEGIKEERAKAEKEKRDLVEEMAFNTARALKKEGVATNIIARTTKLTIEEIDKL